MDISIETSMGKHCQKPYCRNGVVYTRYIWAMSSCSVLNFGDCRPYLTRALSQAEKNINVDTSRVSI